MTLLKTRNLCMEILIRNSNFLNDFHICYKIIARTILYIPNISPGLIKIRKHVFVVLLLGGFIFRGSIFGGFSG